MHQYAASGIKTLLDEGIGGGKMLEQVFIVDVVHLDDEVFVISEQVFIQG